MHYLPQLPPAEFLSPEMKPLVRKNHWSLNCLLPGEFLQRSPELELLISKEPLKESVLALSSLVYHKGQAAPSKSHHHGAFRFRDLLFPPELLEYRNQSADKFVKKAKTGHRSFICTNL